MRNIQKTVRSLFAILALELHTTTNFVSQFHSTIVTYSKQMPSVLPNLGQLSVKVIGKSSMFDFGNHLKNKIKNDITFFRAEIRNMTKLVTLEIRSTERR